MTFPTRAELFQTGVGVAVQRGQLRPPKERLTREAIETPGTDANIVNAQASFMADDVARANAARLRALYLLSAEGADLDRIVKDRFSPTVVRKQASPSVVTQSFTRSAGGFPAATIPIGQRFRTQNGVEFEMRQSVAATAGSAGPFTGLAQAIVPGLAGNVGANTITSPVSALEDPNLIPTNPDVAAGGDDAESDASLRARAVNFYVTARRGTVPAIEFGARTVTGVAKATIEEELDEFGDPTGRVYAYIADANGQANVALADAVELALLEYRAAGVPVKVFAAVPFFVDVTYRLAFETGVDPAAAFAQVQLATVFAVNGLRPRERLRVSLLFSVARSVPGVIVNDDAIVSPIGDIVPTGTQIIRTSTARVTNVA